jgi:ribosome biogenesis GTPase / thiamine phosphate phosphatase
MPRRVRRVSDAIRQENGSHRRTGLVLRSHGGIYEVETDVGMVDAVLRGRVKREARVGDKVVVGDRVSVLRTEVSGQDAWSIEEVEERKSELVRKAPGKAPRAKVIVANLDQVVIVFSVTRPDPHLRMLDRFLVLCESSELEALIVANKVDLLTDEQARQVFGIYEKIGYRVIYTSTKLAAGVSALKAQLRDRISALTGPSGVGKSSLLNEIQPGLALRVASVSDSVQKGRHTTVTAQLIPLEEGGYVADTPGLRELGLWGLERENLHFYFREFEPFLGSCRYSSSCTHTHEPGCAILAAVQSGEVSESRYDSYRRILAGEDEDLDSW